MHSPASLDSGAVPEEVRPLRRPMVVGGLAGFAVGATLIGVLWGVSDAHAGANEDAVAACEALDRSGDLPVTVEGDGKVVGAALLGDGLVSRISAARELAASAAAANPNYQELADHIDSVARMVISLHFNDLSGHRHYEQAKQICARI
ncbi:hypothetical protein [Amycolatopsis sp.]|uniref:hypothetical protein n=1 Tax=Amycolatopsis sp. TaxID=37632 RepID=UPI002E07140F|nr:hypothetical protein [Amycolatopsis sp.]